MKRELATWRGKPIAELTDKEWQAVHDAQFQTPEWVRRDVDALGQRLPPMYASALDFPQSEPWQCFHCKAVAGLWQYKGGWKCRNHIPLELSEVAVEKIRCIQALRTVTVRDLREIHVAEAPECVKVNPFNTCTMFNQAGRVRMMWRRKRDDGDMLGPSIGGTIFFGIVAGGLSQCAESWAWIPAMIFAAVIVLIWTMGMRK